MQSKDVRDTHELAAVVVIFTQPAQDSPLDIPSQMWEGRGPSHELSAMDSWQLMATGEGVSFPSVCSAAADKLPLLQQITFRPRLGKKL